MTNKVGSPTKSAVVVGRTYVLYLQKTRNGQRLVLSLVLPNGTTERKVLSDNELTMLCGLIEGFS